MRTRLILIIWLASWQWAAADVLKFNDFMRKVMMDHPLALQAELQLEAGEAYLLSKKGAMDPRIKADLDHKYYNGTNYYSRSYGGLKIPTWFGPDLETNLKQNNGQYLNPYDYTEGDPLLYFGISIPLGEGLFIDERRAEIKKARLYLDASNSQRQIMMNDLLQDAAMAYMTWSAAHRVVDLYSNALELARQRYQVVKQTYLLGDRPAIDTVEAGIQVKNRLLSLQSAQLKLKNSTLKMEVFLWEKGIIPLELDSATSPEKDILLSGIDSLSWNADSLLSFHPDIVKTSLNLQMLEIEQRWIKEQMKPDLNVSYGTLTPVNGGINPDPNNYVVGLGFEIPVLLRKERGELKGIDVEIQQQQYNLNYKVATLSMDIRQLVNTRNTLNEQWLVYQEIVKDYERLLAGEVSRFNNGESSLFMVNSRELGLIQSELQLIEVEVQRSLVEISFLYRLGILHSQFGM